MTCLVERTALQQVRLLQRHLCPFLYYNVEGSKTL